MNKDFIYKDSSEEILYELYTKVNKGDLDRSDIYLDYLNNWPVFYHTTPLRHNLLNWIDLGERDLDVLEIGAGCGAMTEHLLQVPNVSSVTAIEGDAKRAEINRLRCSSLGTLNLINQNFIDFKSDRKFDVITLIGVFEYSESYISETNPHAYFLSYLKHFLKPDGVLVLAIENRIGHKYIAGRIEDHYHYPYEGINNYPNNKGIRTFSPAELNEIIKTTGFDAIKYYYPFPDYKVPNVILSEKAFGTDGFDWLSLLQLPSPEYCSHHFKPQFNEREFIRAIADNTYVGDFMNSLLIFTSPSDYIFCDDNNFLASKSNILRKKGSRNQVYFVMRNESLQVDRYSIDERKIKESQFYHYNTKNLSVEIIDLMLNKRFLKVSKMLCKWYDLLIRKADYIQDYEYFHKECWQSIKYEPLYNKSNYWIDSGFYDLIPRNILTDDVGEFYIIDQEWTLTNAKIPVQFIFDRGLYWLLHEYASFDTGYEIWNASGTLNIPKEVMNNMDISFSLSDYICMRLLDDFFYAKNIHRYEFSIGEKEYEKAVREINQNTFTQPTKRNIFFRLLKKTVQTMGKNKSIRRVANTILSSH